MPRARRPQVQATIPDGNCLFRSLAVSIVHVFTGKNCGRGSLYGQEKTLAHAVHNVVAEWLRVLLVHALTEQGPITIETAFDGRSLFKTLLKIQSLLRRQEDGRQPSMMARFPSPRAVREFMRRLRPRYRSLPMRGHAGTKMFACGLTADELTQAGRHEEETFSQYCGRLLRRGTWAGAAECYIAAQIVRLPVLVLQRGQHPLTYSPSGDDEDVSHRLVVKFDGVNHYDAVLEKTLPPILHL